MKEFLIDMLYFLLGFGLTVIPFLLFIVIDDYYHVKNARKAFHDEEVTMWSYIKGIFTK